MTQIEHKEMLGFKIVTDFGTFAEFHAIASQKLDEPQAEHQKLKMLEMIKFIYKNVLDDVLYKAVNEAMFNPCLGHFISTLIQVAMNDKYFKIKNEIIEIIDLIINRLNDYYRRTHKGHNSSDLIASFLPGISQFLMKMITKDEKQNKIVYINSLKALSSLFICVFHNYEDGLSERMQNFPLLTPRTKEWRLKSIQKLNIIIGLIERALINHSITVKEALINFTTIIVFHIVDHCENHELMPLISRSLFQIPLTLIYDESESVQQLSLSFTRTISKKLTFHHSKVFILEEQLMDDLLRFVDDFEQELSVYSEERILNNLKLLSGYLNCFNQEKFNIIMCNQKNKFFNLLRLIFKLDFNRMRVNALLKEHTEFTNTDFFDKKFVYFQNKRILNQLDVLCDLIKRSNNQNILTDYLMECLSDVYHKTDSNIQINNNELSANERRSTDFLIASYFVKQFESDSINSKIIERLIDLLNTELGEIENDALYLDERFELTIFCAILIEVITNFGHAIDKNEQRQYLKTTLYTLMACTGSTNLQIQVNAKASIVKLVSLLNYSSVKDLILSNIDYIISSMHIKLNNFNDKENLYFVFKIIFEFTNAEVCYRFDQTLNNLLITMDIKYSIVNFERLARILLLIVRTFKKWFVSNVQFKNSARGDLSSESINEFRNRLIEFLNKKKLDKENLMQFEEVLKIEPVDENMIREQRQKIEEEESKHAEAKIEDEKKCLPIHIDYTKRILEKCSNFLSYNLIQGRLIVLDIIVDGLDVLSSHEDSLLPVAHIVWESLVYRFKDEPIVLFKCTECLLRLAARCGDFIRSRTIKQVLPQIYSFLKLTFKRSLLRTDKIDHQRVRMNENNPNHVSPMIDSAFYSSMKPSTKSISEATQSIKSCESSSMMSSSNAFYYSLDHRLQWLLLENLGILAYDIRLSRKDLWPLITVLLLYLNDRQSDELRTAAYSSLCVIERLDCYAVHFFRNYYL